jgi:hypothetical protein
MTTSVAVQDQCVSRNGLRLAWIAKATGPTGPARVVQRSFAVDLPF